MHTTYRLKANELDQNFLEGIKKTFQDKEIEIVVYEIDETDYLLRSEANRARLLTAKTNVEQGTNLVERTLEEL